MVPCHAPAGPSRLQVLSKARQLVQEGDRGLGELAASLVQDVVKRVGSTYYMFEAQRLVWIKCNNSMDVWITVSKALKAQLEALEAYIIAEAVGCIDENTKKSYESERAVIRH